MIDTIVLAGGKGKRMGTPLPKALVEMGGKPMISYVINSITNAGLTQPVIVVGYGADEVKSSLGDTFRYVEQKEQLGTGHAVQCGVTSVHEDAEAVIVIYCDHPLISADVIKKIADTHRSAGTTITLATVKVPDFNEWRAPLHDFGRIVRNAEGSIVGIVEKKDATPEQIVITEMNPGYYCFNTKWLVEALPKLQNTNAQKEYYLTDLISMAIRDGHNIMHVDIPTHEALGANTPEQLAVLETFLK